MLPLNKVIGAAFKLKTHVRATHLDWCTGPRTLKCSFFLVTVKGKSVITKMCDIFLSTCHHVYCNIWNNVILMYSLRRHFTVSGTYVFPLQMSASQVGKVNCSSVIEHFYNWAHFQLHILHILPIAQKTEWAPLEFFIWKLLVYKKLKQKTKKLCTHMK